MKNVTIDELREIRRRLAEEQKLDVESYAIMLRKVAQTSPGHYVTQPILPQTESLMNLNIDQKRAIENGEPVAINLAGFDCIVVRKDIYLRLDPDYDTGPWTIEEMNLLADEAEELISRSESHAN